MGARRLDACTLLVVASLPLGGCLFDEPECDAAREKYEDHFDRLVAEAEEEGATLRSAGCDEYGTFYVVDVVFPSSSLPVEMGGLSYDADHVARRPSVVCVVGRESEQIRAYAWEDGGVNVKLTGAPYPGTCDPEELVE